MPCKDVRRDSRLADFYDFYTLSIDRYTRPYPGIPELLERLQNDGCHLAVASNKFQAGATALICRFFPDIRFVSVLGNRPGVPLKPSPHIVKEISGQCGGEVRAIMVGDTAIDIETARCAGIPAIAVTWGFRSRAELLAADAIADNAGQLYEAYRIFLWGPAT